MSDLLDKIHENIKNINKDQKKLNRESVPLNKSQQYRDHLSRVNKNNTMDIGHDSIVKINSTSKNYNKIDYEDLLHKLSNDKDYLEVLDRATQRNIPTEDINKFIEDVLPNKTLISYYYNDKFNTLEKFDEWNNNFIFVENPERAYKKYSKEDLIRSSQQDSNQYLEFFNNKNELILGEAYSSHIRELESDYAAKIERPVDKEKVDEKLKVKLVESSYKDTKNKFSDSKRNMNPSLKSMLTTKKRWEQGPNTIGRDPTNILNNELFKSQKAGEKDLTKGDEVLRKHFSASDITFNSTNGVESATITRSNFSYVSNIFVERMLNQKGIEIKLNNGSKATRDYYGLNKDYLKKRVHPLSNDYAYRPMGNLAYSNVMVAKNESPFVANWVPRWSGVKWVGEGAIPDALYSLYASSWAVPSLGLTANHFFTNGVSTKSELDLQRNISIGLDARKTMFDWVNKLHAATVIGFRTYSKSGDKRTMFLSSSRETIPDTREEYKDFSKGRQVAALNISREKESRIRNNSAISALINSGPDFMGNMFDVSIISYKDVNGDTSKTVTSVVPLINFFVDNNVYNKSKSAAENSMKDNEDSFNNVLKQTPTSTVSMLKNPNDFLTRVVSISIPNMKTSTIEYGFLNQKYAVPGYKNEQEFSSTFSLELDAGLEYMRLFNALSGLRLKNSSPDGPFREQLRPLRNRYGKQKLGILVKLIPNNPFISIKNYSPTSLSRPETRFIVFEDVLFLGGGDVKFSSNSNGGIVNYNQQFIYKNLNIYPFTGADGEIMPEAKPSIQMGRVE